MNKKQILHIITQKQKVVGQNYLSLYKALHEIKSNPTLKDLVSLEEVCKDIILGKTNITNINIKDYFYYYNVITKEITLFYKWSTEFMEFIFHNSSMYIPFITRLTKN